MSFRVDDGGSRVAPSAPKAEKKVDTAPAAETRKQPSVGFKTDSFVPAGRANPETLATTGKPTGGKVEPKAGSVDPAGNPPINTGATAEYKPVPNSELFVDGKGDGNAISPNDVKQGGAADCYFISSLATVAQQDPQKIRDMIHDNGNGTYTVTFHEKQDKQFWEFWKPDWKDVKITVNGDLPTDKNGNTVYAYALDEQKNDGSSKRETWVAIAEKAYAQYKGSYHAAEWGFGDKAMELITGKSSQVREASKTSIDDLANAHASKQGVTVQTLTPEQAKNLPAYKDGTLATNHVYYVTGVDKAKNEVILHNPWGYDPEIRMSYADFQKNFGRLSTNPIH